MLGLDGRIRVTRLVWLCPRRGQGQGVTKTLGFLQRVAYS